ncbi:hypothetical protein HW090_17515 [Pseudomonas sp. ABC1]|uniref:hypothetical protein n=1 Tax=Pseudomonas sp. ABC1 TaxID=2748080 RepID=UPI0015C39E8D|nr:hypothetical protein [Pseudomonas sp. ABC1]QLF94883.1 hypothetical protein HW090_17515 [Pseudomonas sp. ABC1]
MSKSLTQLLLLPLLGFLIVVTAQAGTYEWTSGWAMGTTEYLVDDGNGNELNISCPDDEDRYISAFATIQGKRYSSDEGAGFDVIVDGELYSNPFNTDCRVCADIFKHAFWEDLYRANRLQITADGQTVNLPVKNIGNVLLPLNDPYNSCRVAW